MKRGPDICVMGSLNMDLVASVPRRPRSGETISSTAFAMVPGGKGANQAVAAARLGATSALIGRVGADAYGDALRRSLTADGVDISQVVVDDHSPTGIALIMVEPGGENSIVLVPGANAAVTIADVDAATDMLTGAKALLVQMEMPAEVATRALALGRAKGLRTVFNQAPAFPIPRDMYSAVDVLVVNETEAHELTGIEASGVPAARAAAAVLHSLGAGAVVVTLGSRGALIHQSAGHHVVEALPVTAVDTTAAGDAFVAALAVMLLRNDDLVAATEYAVRAATLSVSRPGAQPSLPTAAEVASWSSAEGRPPVR